MNKSEWLEKAKIHQDKLIGFVATSHPTSNQNTRNLPITAIHAEKACQAIRKDIVKLDFNLTSASERLNTAFNENNADEIYNLLQESWFGVPESLHCWEIRGFSEAVNLLEDPWDWEE